MHKILLINPIFGGRKIVNIIPNIGLAYLATALRKKGYSVALFDGLKRGANLKKCIQLINAGDYDIVGIQVFTYALKIAKYLTEVIKANFPNAIVVVGGPHPSGDFMHTLQYLSKVDFGFKGEGEIGLSILADKINENSLSSQLQNIPGLIYREGSEIKINHQLFFEDLDELNLPAWDLILPQEYPDAPIGAFIKNLPVAGIQCTRGCPYNCTFCAASSIYGKKIRFRTKENILSEIELLNKKYGVKEIHIVDDNFTFNKQFAKEVADDIIKNKIKINIAFPNGVRVDTLDEELIKLLEKAGCYSISIGIESGSQKILEHMRKKLSLSKVEEICSLIKKVSNIRITGFFIIGYPEENEEDVLETIKISKKLPLSRAQFAMYIPVPGSEMYEMLKKEGKIREHFFNYLLFQDIRCYAGKISKVKFKKLRTLAYLQFYLRFKIIAGILREIKSYEQLVFIVRRVFKLI